MENNTTYNCIYNSSKKLLLKLLDTNIVIILYGKGGCGKTVFCLMLNLYNHLCSYKVFSLQILIYNSYIFNEIN